MKVLLLYPDLPLSLMSFSKSCNNIGAKSFTPPLGLITIAAMLPEDWEPKLVDLNCTDLSEADWKWADVVLISGMILQSQGMLALVREAKSRGKFVVCGGAYVTSVPEPVLEAGADVLVRGEAETIREEILEAITARQTGKVIQAPDKPDVTTSPTPRYDLLNLSNYLSMAVQTSRGCPFECEFCDVVNLYGRKMRYKTPDQVVAELESLHRLGWTGLVFVSDDNFIGSKSRAQPILREIVAWSKSRGEPFSFATQASINLGQDPDLIDLMTEANFSYVLVGVESPDQAVLARNRKMQNIDNPVVDSLHALNDRGLTVIASFVIGFDGEESGVQQRILDLVQAAGLGLVFVNVLQALPNTKLWNRLLEEGRLRPEITSGETLASRMNFVPSRPVEEIMQEWADAWAQLYEPNGCLERISRSCLSMRPTRRAMGMEPADPSTNARKNPSTPWNKRMQNLTIFSKLIQMLGLRPSTAVQFWRKIFVVRKKNPSRLVRYLENCSFAANMFMLRDEIRKRSATGA
ncbi:MAG: B12-binding domain-containing radical SAM protein [Desulfomonile tiedjei]|nr:B12-binding domain-containing radical SAM protein [Desulfomonile tiedjei]